MIIDGEGCVLGRLASVTSKNLLEGEEVVNILEDQTIYSEEL